MTSNTLQIITEPGRSDMTLTRNFDAPVDLLYKAFSEVEWLEQFFAPEGNIIKYTDTEIRNGGSYTYTVTKADGTFLCRFRGVYHEVVPNTGMVLTSEMEGVPGFGNVLLEFIRFIDLGNNQSQLVIHDLCPSEQIRDMIIKSGMETGLVSIFNRLDQLFKQRQSI